ncbi:MAG: internal scaffolding protein [Microvirus sp.]|nr:MAG: internal scaffolding protein [Microvirus sp.]
MKNNPFRDPWDTAAMDRASQEAGSNNTDPRTGEVLPSKTVQGPAADCDINTIAKAYGLTAGSRLPVPPEAMDPRYYGDLSEAPETLHEAFALVEDATSKFAVLPANVRSRFSHSPGVMWEFLQDPANWPEAEKLGLLVRPAEPAPPASPPPASPKEDA